ncbi:MAG: DUF721 domain-containing protein [Muribaculaceae bacterium]|nr:DUF721 domain-containing protein [Bacteroidales bacterium]MDE6243989.1 DUF721 domain-containing protein [Muribaculaceae bacterium]
MKRTEPLKISEIVDKLLRDRDMEDTLLQHRALAAWPQVVGPIINRATVERRVAGGTLWLRITSAPVRQELTMNRTALLRALNNYVGKDVITDIKFV